MVTQILEKLKVAIVGLEWDIVDLIDSLTDVEIAGFIDPMQIGESLGVEYLGTDKDWEALKNKEPSLKVALAIDFPAVRKKLFAHYGLENLLTLISPFAHVSKRAVIGYGSLIQRGVTVMPNVEVGEACKLNVNATVHHDAHIGSFTTLAPGCQVLGRVVIEEGVYVGAGTIIRQRCRIGKGAVIGAGAVVVRDVSAGETVAGVPAKKL